MWSYQLILLLPTFFDPLLCVGFLVAFLLVTRLSSRFTDVLSSLHHRGPDSTGIGTYLLSQHLVLAHSRLSIIDLSSAGTQPFTRPDFSHLSLVFNGEIYNYIELRSDLEELGFQFTTSTDTEVLFLAWSHWGLNCLDKLYGIFSFIVYDSLTNDLIIVRDPFGVKPLYYTPCSVNGEFFFSSNSTNFRLSWFKASILTNLFSDLTTGIILQNFLFLMSLVIT